MKTTLTGCARRKLFRFFTVTAVAICATSVFSSKSFAKSRVLHFPKQSMGDVFVLERNLSYFDATIRMKCIAVGDVPLADSESALLEANSRFWLDKKLRKEISPLYIEHLKLRFNTVSDDDDANSHEVFKELNRFSELKTVILDRADVDDSLVEELKSLKNLNTLSVGGTMVKGKFLKAGIARDHLKVLRLNSTSLDADNLLSLVNYPGLRFLFVANADLTPAGLENISKCKQLSTLDISRNKKITDKSAPCLSGMKNLDNLNLLDTNISCKTLQSLAKSLPKTLIHASGRKNTYSASELKALSSIKNIQIHKPVSGVGGARLDEAKVIFAPTMRE